MRRIGETHHRAKLNDSAVHRMRELRERNPVLWTYAALGEVFRCSEWTVRDMCVGKTRSAPQTPAFALQDVWRQAA